MMMDFERAILTLMAEKGIRSRRELARLAGLHINTIGHVMRMQDGIPIRSLPDIARALGVTPSEVIRRAEQPND